MATSSVSSSMRIELLSKDNYDTWCMQVEALLIKNDLWEYVSGEKTCPAADKNDERARWLSQDKKAKADLVMAIQPSELKQIRGCATSREVWLKLESIFASKGPARKATLLKQLILQKLEDSGDVRDHIGRFFDAVDKLENMGVPINGDLLAIMLLYSLPASFENFRCAIESRDELPSAEVLKVKIMEESEARKQASGSVVTAMVAGNRRNVRQNCPRQGKGKSDLKSEFKGKCYKCGIAGHRASVCPTIKSGDKKPKLSANSVDHTYCAVSHTVTTNVNSASSEKVTDKAWLLDSGCTAHLCGDENRFKTMGQCTKTKLNLANQASAEVKGKGIVHVSVASNKGHKLIEFKDTLFVPELRTNLISVAKITNAGHEVTFRQKDAYIRDECENVLVIADRRGDLYYVRENSECANVQSECSELLKWHRRLGHLNAKDLIKLVRNGVVPLTDAKGMEEQLRKCDVCAKGKMTALPFEKRREPCGETLGIVHSDVVGPFRTESAGRAKYFVTFIDDSTRWVEIYFLRQKCGVFEAFQMYQKLVEKQTGKKIKCLQSDNGREYCNREFDKYLADQGIRRRLTVPNTPQQNGVAERMNRTLLDMARCLLLESDLGASFWSEAVATACHLRNRCPTSSLKGAVPFEKWTGRVPRVDYLRTFGAKVMVSNKDPNRDKLAWKATEGVFVGYPRCRKGYRVWLPSKRQIVDVRDVKFIEEIQRKTSGTGELDELFTSEQKREINNKETPKVVEVSFHPTQNNDEEERRPNIPEIRVIPEEDTRRGPGRPRLVRSGSRGRPRKLFHSRTVTPELDEEEMTDPGDIEDEVFANVAEVSVQTALKSDAREEWKDAIEAEMTSLLKNDTFDIVKKGDGENIVGCRLVLTNKHGADGEIERRKARLVAKGYSQKYGVDYHQTFAPVARLETLRLLLALSVEFGLKIWQFDVVTAYLNGALNEKVLMRVPEMFSEMLERIVSKQDGNTGVGAKARKMLSDLRDGGNACKLKKALYGLKQAGRQWYLKLSTKLVSMGLKVTKNESCLFYDDARDGLLFVLVYVDDILVALKSAKCIEKIKRGLLEEFEIKDLGPAKYCLGLEINQEEGQISLLQTNYILGLLKQYGMSECNPVVTPSDVNVRFNDTKDSGMDEEYRYRELIGALMYLAVASRPDIANTASRLAQFVNKPSRCYWLAAKRVLRYLCGTAKMGLVYSKTSEPLVWYTDADWGGCIVDRRSYTGYAFILSGAAIAWKSQKQKTVALSSTEAEYVSLAEASKEALYLRSVLCELGLDDWAEITIFIDNRGAQFLASDPMFHARTKHIDIKHHFVRESISAGKFVLEHISTGDMVADVLTKSLARVNHEKCLEGLGLKIRID